MGSLIGENEMETDEIPGCCAASILWDFPYPIRNSLSRKEKKEFQTDVQKYILHNLIANKIIVAILDDIQYRLYRGLMNKYGFRLLLRTSGNDSQYIYLMAKARKQRKRK